jgi:hypothetical protein
MSITTSSLISKYDKQMYYLLSDWFFFLVSDWLMDTGYVSTTSRTAATSTTTTNTTVAPPLTEGYTLLQQ